MHEYISESCFVYGDVQNVRKELLMFVLGVIIVIHAIQRLRS
jgi:hypothetical protein